MNEDLYYKFWSMYLGFDFQDIQKGRILTKGEFYRLHTTLAGLLADSKPLPARFKLVERPPFIPYVERHGKIKEKTILENNKN